MTVVFVKRAGTWFHFTSSWLLGLRGCFVDCCCYWCCFYQGQQACKHLGKWTVSLIVTCGIVYVRPLQLILHAPVLQYTAIIELIFLSGVGWNGVRLKMYFRLNQKLESKVLLTRISSSNLSLCRNGADKFTLKIRWFHLCTTYMRFTCGIFSSK